MCTKNVLCATGRALLDEVGPMQFPVYVKRLPERGWAGQKTPVEAAYVKAHGGTRSR